MVVVIKGKLNLVNMAWEDRVEEYVFRNPGIQDW